MNVNYSVFDTLDVPTFVVRSDLSIVYCNEAATFITEKLLQSVMDSKTKLSNLLIFPNEIPELRNLRRITKPTSYKEYSYKDKSSEAKFLLSIQPSPSKGPEPEWILYFKTEMNEPLQNKKFRAQIEQKENIIHGLHKAQVDLVHYSENLGKLVLERTEQALELNKTIRALLDSLHQGFFIFNQNGICMDVYSKACKTILETTPENKPIWELFKMDASEIPAMKDWLKATFNEMLPFNDMRPLAPQTYPHSLGKNITIEYYPIRNEDNKIEAIVGVASDVTELIAAQKEIESEKNHARMVLALVKYRRQLSSFLRDADNIFQTLKHEFDQPQIDPEIVFRALHTMNGGCATFCISSVMELCYQAESQLTIWKKTKDETDFEKLKFCYHQVVNSFHAFLSENELIIGDAGRNKERWVETPANKLASFIENHNFPKSVVESFTAIFLTEPLKDFISHYNDVMQAVAQNENKSVNDLIINHPNLKLIPEPYESLFTSLIHAFRNAVDHGIETPEVRIKNGKPEYGTITVDAEIIDDMTQKWLQICISDDGGGIKPEKIRQRLVTKGVDCAHESDEQVIQHVFDSDLSTKEVVTHTSGRGVGMDAILHSAMDLGGNAWVESQINKGTKLFIKVPYMTIFPLQKNTEFKKVG